MRALVHDPDTPYGLRLGEAPDPEPGPSDAIVHVAAASLNFGEVAFLRERVAPGAVAGWDASGTVVAAAADGSGPPAGARVATFGSSGAWAQQRAADTGELDPQIGWRGSWDRADEAADALIGRRVRGKAILEVGL